MADLEEQELRKALSLSGALDSAEIEAAIQQLTALDRPARRADVQEILKEFDYDQNGVLSREEFAAFVQVTIRCEDLAASPAPSPNAQDDSKELTSWVNDLTAVWRACQAGR